MGVVCGSHAWGTPAVACPIPNYRYGFCRWISDGDNSPAIEESIQVVRFHIRRDLYCDLMANALNVN